jgi:hypothetical protein
LITALFAGLEASRPDLAHADAVLAAGGTRLMTLEDGSNAIGIWGDLDSAELRQGIRAFGWSESLIRYLDGPSIPDRYRIRQVGGECVPLSVLRAMEQAPQEPWVIRDTLLAEMGWRATSRKLGAGRVGNDHLGNDH